MEDGEIADSDEEHGTSSTLVPDFTVPSTRIGLCAAPQYLSSSGISSVQSTRERLLAPRSRKKRDSSSDSCSSRSSDSDKDDSGSEATQRREATHCSRADTHFGPVTASSTNRLMPATVKKVNNVWGSVLAEQTLTQELTDVGVARRPVCNDRSVESYDFRPINRSCSPSTDGSVDGDSEHEYGTSGGVSQSASGTSSRSHSSERAADAAGDATGAGSNGCRSTTRPSVKERLGKVPDSLTAVTANSSPDDVARYIAVMLEEPKSALIVRVVEVLGTEKALYLFQKTRDIEDAGGLMTKDGSRRRTPGGVFLALLRDEISKDQERQIFAIEMQLEKQKEKQKRKRHRERRYCAKKYILSSSSSLHRRTSCTIFKGYRLWELNPGPLAQKPAHYILTEKTTIGFLTFIR